MSTTSSAAIPGAVRQRLLSGGMWALGGRVGLAVIGFLNNALLARVLSPAELGVYFLAFTIVGLLASLGSLGLTKSIVRFVAESIGLGQYGRARRAIKLSLVYGTLGALVVGVAYTLFGGELAARLFDSPALAAVAGLTAGWMLVAVVQGILVEAFRGLHDIRMTIILGGFASGQGFLTGGLVVGSLAVVWLVWGHTDLATVMLLATGSGAASTLLAWILLRRRVGKLPQEDSKPALGGAEMIRVAWPLMGANLMLLVLAQVGYWIAGFFLRQQDVALYGAAFRLMTYVEMPLAIAGMVTPPIIAEMYAQGRTRELERILRSVATVAFVPCFIVLLSFVFFGGPIMGFAFGSFYQAGGIVLAILSLGQLVNVWTGSCLQVLMMIGEQGYLMLVTVITGFAMIIGAILGAAFYGLVGMTVSISFFGAAVQNVLMMVVVRRRADLWTHVELSLLWNKMRSIYTVR